MKYTLTLIIAFFSSRSLANQDLVDAINAANAKISAAQSFISSANGKVTSINKEASDIKKETLRLKGDALLSQTKTASMRRENKVLVERIDSELKPRIILIEQNIAEEDHNLNNSTRARDNTIRLNASFSDNQKRFKSILDDFTKIEAQHENWIRELEAHMKNNTPNFQSIVDVRTYNQVVKNIANTFGNVPSTASLLIKESRLGSDINTYMSLTKLLVEDIREFASSEEHATMRRLTKSNGSLSVLEKVDAQLRANFNDLSRIEQTVRNATRQREILRLDIFRIWYAYATLRMHLLNISNSSELITKINRILASPDIYAEIRASTDLYENILGSQVGDIYPFSADKSLKEAMEFKELIASRIDNIDLSEAFRREITLLLEDFDRSLGIYSESVDSMVDEVNDYMSEWKRITRLRVRRLGANISSECLSLSNAIRSESDPRRAEEKFLTFRSKC